MDTQMNYKQHNTRKKMKRFRSAFTTDQVNYLEKQYQKCPYISNDQREEIAAKLHISERAIKIWFQNRRMKEKREGGGLEFDNEQIRHAEYTKYSKRLLNNVIKSSFFEPLPSETLLNGKDLNENFITNHSTDNIDQMIPLINSELSTASAAQNTVSTAKIEQNSVLISTDALSTESGTTAEKSINLSKKCDGEKLSKTVMKKQASQMELDESKSNQSNNSIQQEKTEKLTTDNKIYEPVSTTTEITSNNPGLTSVPTVPSLYPQNYFPMVWNQMDVSVNPSASISAPSTLLVNNVSSSQDKVVIKKCWHCDPNIRQLMAQVPYTFLQQNPNYQYFITAVPLQDPSTKLP
ncbi:unnamed protein product [Spodoptera exigua]|nr:unnamed protein product [Spodoptera exigua]